MPPFELQQQGCSQGGGDVKDTNPLPRDFSSLSNLLLINTGLDLKPRFPELKLAGAERRQAGWAAFKDSASQGHAGLALGRGTPYMRCTTSWPHAGASLCWWRSILCISSQLSDPTSVDMLMAIFHQGNWQTLQISGSLPVHLTPALHLGSGNLVIKHVPC